MSFAEALRRAQNDATRKATSWSRDPTFLAQQHADFAARSDELTTGLVVDTETMSASRLATELASVIDVAAPSWPARTVVASQVAAVAEASGGDSESGGSKAVASPGPVGSQASHTRKTTTLTLWLRVENNSKFVRGKTKARENIETYHLRRHAMQKLRGWEYELTFAYEDDADLDRQVEELLSEISREADLRNCFIEADLCEKGTERSW